MPNLHLRSLAPGATTGIIQLQLTQVLMSVGQNKKGAYENPMDVVDMDSTAVTFKRQVKIVREEDNQSKRQK